MNKNAFDFIRNSLNRIADGIASSDGRYPVWDYKSLLELINTLEEEYKKNDGASARSSLQQTCNNLATDTISRQAAIAEFSCCELTPDGGIDANYAIDFLKQLPSAQPEQTDCEYCHEDSDGYVRPIEKNSHAWLVRRGRTMKLRVGFKGEYRECDILFCPMCGRRLTDG